MTSLASGGPLLPDDFVVSSGSPVSFPVVLGELALLIGLRLLNAAIQSGEPPLPEHGPDQQRAKDANGQHDDQPHRDEHTPDHPPAPEGAATARLFDKLANNRSKLRAILTGARKVGIQSIWAGGFEPPRATFPRQDWGPAGLAIRCINPLCHAHRTEAVTRRGGGFFPGSRRNPTSRHDVLSRSERLTHECPGHTVLGNSPVATNDCCELLGLAVSAADPFVSSSTINRPIQRVVLAKVAATTAAVGSRIHSEASTQ